MRRDTIEKIGFLGEFSIDIGEDESGSLFIYEVNSKPMQFDEVEIETNRLLHLKNLFIELTFPNLTIKITPPGAVFHYN